MNPALKPEPTPVHYPSALPGINTYLKRNPLYQALPPDAEDCPPEDQYVSPAIVARNVQPFLALLPTPRHGSATKPFPRAASKSNVFLHELENAHWTAITLMQGRPATVEQMATVKVTGLPSATWLQVIQCLRLSHFDSAAVLSTMGEDTFNRCVEFIARLAHSDLHELMGMRRPYPSFTACPTARAWHGANHSLGSCFKPPKPTKPAPSDSHEQPNAPPEGHPDDELFRLLGVKAPTPKAPPNTPKVPLPPTLPAATPTAAPQQSPAPDQASAPAASVVSPDDSATGATKRPPTSPPRCPAPDAKKPKDVVLVSKLLPDIKQWWNPAEGAVGKLMYEVDKPIPTRTNANCTEDLHQTLLPEIDWELAGKGFLGWKNDAQPNSNNFVAHEVPKALKTLLTLIKGEPVTTEEEEWLLKHGIPAHTCFHYVQCIVTNNVNLHLVPALMPDSEFHGLIVTIFRLANTPLSKFCEFNSIRGEAPATPATMLWQACIDNVGSLHSASRKAPKAKQQTYITAFIPGWEATPAPLQLQKNCLARKA